MIKSTYERGGTMKTVRVYGVQIICFCFLLLAAAYFFPVGSTGNADQNGKCEPYRSGWQVTIGDGIQGMNWDQDAQLPEYIAMSGVSQITLERMVEEPDIVGFFIFSNRCMYIWMERRYSIFIIVVAVTSMMDLYGYYFSNDPDVARYSRFGYFGYILAVTVALLLDYMNLVMMGQQAEVIKKEASIDAMTKLHNRAEFERDMDRFTAKNSRKMGVVMFDLNNLKYVNDTFGHEMGDYYIINGSRVIYESFEKCGRIYRIGGDEFCCIAKNLSEEAYMERSREMELRIADFHVEGDNAPDITMAIASGYAAFDSSVDNDLKETMKRADVRMYERKKQLKAKKDHHN